MNRTELKEKLRQADQHKARVERRVKRLRAVAQEKQRRADQEVEIIEAMFPRCFAVNLSDLTDPKTGRSNWSAGAIRSRVMRGDL